MIVLSVYHSLFSRVHSIHCAFWSLYFSSLFPSFPFLFSRPLSFLVKRDNRQIFSQAQQRKGVSVENFLCFTLCSLTKFIFHSILTHKLSFTPFQKLVISFPSHASPHSSPRQRPLRAPRAAFGQRLEAGNLQDLARCIVTVARIG